MKLRYFQYCLANRLFYEEPNGWRADRACFEPVAAEPPPGWRSRRSGPWCHYLRDGGRLPAQGWKIHVSAARESAEKVLRITADYCLKHQIAFKFLVSEAAFISRNLKYADRGGSGKFITLYPDSDERLRAALEELSEALHGLGGAYVLTDLRWGEGPLYLRYGAFTERFTRNELGEPVPAIEDPEGNLVPDNREPVFSVPEWVRPPQFLIDALQSRQQDEAPKDFPYDIRSALHFSNSGGIYLATDRGSGRTVVLKEARPHAGLDPSGRDAVARLRHEWEVLRELADVEGVVDAYDHLVVWEHHFLVQEYVEGRTLSTEIAARHPLVHPDTDPAAVAAFTRWALDTTAQVEAAIGRLHRRGTAFGDLHPNNIMVRGDGRIVLLDFELAARADQPRTGVGMGAPGFFPPDRRDALAADRYALACLKIAVFLPLTMLLTLDPSRAEALVDAVRRRFDVPADWAEGVLRDLDLAAAPPSGTPGQVRRSSALIAGDGGHGPDWGAIEASVARAVWDSATPERADRLFPGDVEQFRYSGLGLAYGAAGVLYALAAGGHGRRPEYEDWLLRRVREHEGPHRLGCYDGLHGIAYALDQIGRHDDAVRTLELAQRAGTANLGADLFSGLAGVALNQLHFAARLGDRELRAAALDAAGRLAARAAERARGAEGRDRVRAGLMHGDSGAALLFVRLYEETGDTALLGLAEQALRRDLARCVHDEAQDALYVDDGSRRMPYVAVGSAGIGLVLREFLRHREDPGLRAALARIRRAAEAEFCVFPMLFEGAAGQIGFLGRLREPGRVDGLLEEKIALKRDRLHWHMVGLHGEIAFPGDQLMRLSMDLATGGAGVVLALAAVRDPCVPLLPFLSAVPAPAGPDSPPPRPLHREPLESSGA
ncbi:class III lanthionine synthetase LanKC [Allonocardiopsis opalescens]|uniref:non-specific serine/threonine protein kinase n=1 Tax=Allonocardiopsis opalescens TaxID=1144618 RepID=A0A2T0Q779_9ACTN|nr:class III lanthionine synthetase LanKC [Allonocardiopsis opalescens]PRX99668.1 lanthionine synthetase-like protein [Allonocardiopsis opalescens]